MTCCHRQGDVARGDAEGIAFTLQSACGSCVLSYVLADDGTDTGNFDGFADCNTLVNGEPPNDVSYITATLSSGVLTITYDDGTHSTIWKGVDYGDRRQFVAVATTATGVTVSDDAANPDNGPVALPQKWCVTPGRCKVPNPQCITYPDSVPANTLNSLCGSFGSWSASISVSGPLPPTGTRRNVGDISSSLRDTLTTFDDYTESRLDTEAVTPTNPSGDVYHFQADSGDLCEQPERSVFVCWKNSGFPQVQTRAVYYDEWRTGSYSGEFAPSSLTVTASDWKFQYVSEARGTDGYFSGTPSDQNCDFDGSGAFNGDVTTSEGTASGQSWTLDYGDDESATVKVEAGTFTRVFDVFIGSGTSIDPCELIGEVTEVYTVYRVVGQCKPSLQGGVAASHFYPSLFAVMQYTKTHVNGDPDVTGTTPMLPLTHGKTANNKTFEPYLSVPSSGDLEVLLVTDYEFENADCSISRTLPSFSGECPDFGGDSVTATATSATYTETRTFSGREVSD